MNGTLQLVGLSARASRVAALAATCCLALAAQGQITLIPPASVSTSATVTGLSADGSVASGYSSGLQATPGFRWTPAGGRYDFGLESGFSVASPSYAISADGSTLVGTTDGAALRWSGPGTRQLLGIQSPYARSEALATNADGSVIVGQSYTESGIQGIVASQAFRWTLAGNLQGLGFLRPGSDRSNATAVTPDGNTITGFSRANGVYEGFVWTPSGGMTALPFLPGTQDATPTAISADGSIVLGTSGGSIVQWRNGQVVDLGYPTGYGAGVSTAMSADGMVAGGRMRSPTFSDVPAIWTPATGMLPFTQYLRDRDIHIPAGVTLFSLNAISADGTTFGGSARFNNQTVGYVVRVPSPASALIPLFAFALTRRRRA